MRETHKRHLVLCHIKCDYRQDQNKNRETGLALRSMKLEAEASVLCWFATVSPQGVPNVSPKEVFALLDDHNLVVADIASPNTVRNLRANAAACVSFIDIFRQTGYKLVGRADVIPPSDGRFEALSEPLLEITKGQFEIRHVLHMSVETASPILAPGFRVHPGISLPDRIAGVMKVYGVKDARDRTGHPTG